MPDPNATDPNWFHYIVGVVIAMFGWFTKRMVNKVDRLERDFVEETACQAKTSVIEHNIQAGFEQMRQEHRNLYKTMAANQKEFNERFDKNNERFDKLYHHLMKGNHNHD